MRTPALVVIAVYVAVLMSVEVLPAQVAWSGSEDRPGYD